MIMQKIIINFPMTILHEATFPRINEMGRRNREALTILSRRETPYVIFKFCMLVLLAFS